MTPERLAQIERTLDMSLSDDLNGNDFEEVIAALKGFMPIPVSERLPEAAGDPDFPSVSDEVMAYDGDHWYSAWFQRPDHWESLEGTRLDVTHWMPLPPNPVKS